MARKENEKYPDFTAFIDVIEQDGITPQLLSKIIIRHRPNSKYNEQLYKRYQAIDGGVPIFKREPRYDEADPINNKVNNDFFSEIVDFKTGYFAGQPIAYGYSSNEESENVTGGVEAVEKATKVLTDFTTRNNMYGVDMETTKFASIYGYAGRLFYIDLEGTERVMPVHGYETIILSRTDISEPQYAIRYYKTYDINNNVKWVVEFYDNTNIYTYKGMLSGLVQDGEPQPHLFDYCPLQGIANNKELTGDPEKVLALIDDYDKVLSDNSNEIESFVHAIMLVGVNIPNGTIREAQKSGALIVPMVGSNTVQEPIKWLTKNIDDAFTEHHLQRIEDNIYRFSRTPNLNDDTFGSASGVSLKFKLHGLETKCGMFQAKMLDASQYMFKLLASVWAKKQIVFDPLQVILEFKRNFPLDELSEAQTAQARIGAGLPKEWVFSQMASVDDPNYIMEMIKSEKSDISSLYEDIPMDKEQGE
ncbi:MAG: phage portal protein [Clostridia bacterium]|nr:phage portal protein [Clostridia bacterium]